MEKCCPPFNSPGVAHARVAGKKTNGPTRQNPASLRNRCCMSGVFDKARAAFLKNARWLSLWPRLSRYFLSPEIFYLCHSKDTERSMSTILPLHCCLMAAVRFRDV